MNKILYLIVAMVMLTACKEAAEKEVIVEAIETQIRKPQRVAITHAVLENAVIYEANIRQYSEEGTFTGFTKDIPQLKELGVQVLWLMPIHPISLVKRKAENDTSIEDIASVEDRQKYLGSPYAVANYRAVNPDFGTLEDFRALVQTAHDNDIYVIIDWVPNHTGWDHPWIKEHPEYYTKDATGAITDPLKDDGEPWGWTDVADLNYDNENLQQAMIDEMLFWVEQEGIDGFRCDVAHGVPASFWEKSIPQLRSKKPLFMLAESEITEIMTGNLFDMSYGWEVHHLLNDIANGMKNAADFNIYMEKYQSKWEQDDILMNFVTNHDENAWAGPVQERMGAASNTLLALTYCIPGMPLVYSGQEYELSHRLKFFEKDRIPKQKGATYKLLQKLGVLKHNLTALSGGKEAASYEPITTSQPDQVLAFKRVKEDNELVYLANLSKEPAAVSFNTSGTFINAMTGETVVLIENQTMSLKPWEYLILRK